MTVIEPIAMIYIFNEKDEVLMIRDIKAKNN